MAIRDYFEVFGLSRKLEVDLNELERRYYELSRRYHPDFSMKASPQEQALNLERSALVNRAYRTLRDPVSRVEHLIELEEGGTAGIQPKAPMDLLEAILEIQEGLTEAKAGLLDETTRRRLEEDRQRLSERLANEEQALLALGHEWDVAAQNGERQGILNRFKQHLASRAYLTTVIKDLDEALGAEPNVSHRRH